MSIGRQWPCQGYRALEKTGVPGNRDIPDRNVLKGNMIRGEYGLMKIIISPAKKMNIDTDSFAVDGRPEFIEDTKVLMDAVKSLSLSEARALWKCNDKLAELNYQRFRDMDLERALTPAVMSYEGLQYQHMAPGVFTQDALSYIAKHLRILSGFYGILKPFDGVTPYRLEMQAGLSVNGCRDLYEFWGERLYRSLFGEDECPGTVINLASKEYSKCIEKYITSDDRFITAEFGEWNGGKVKQKGTLAKMARGEMVRFLAENQICDPEDMKEFHALGFSYCGDLSAADRYVFISAGSGSESDYT